MRPTLVLALALAACGEVATTPSTAKVRQNACGQATDETARVMAQLAPVCEGCHVTGARGFFASVDAFQNLVVSDPRLIVPGDPDNSEFIRLLEGTGTRAFKQMPIGTTTYSQLLAAGTATVTIDQVKDWVRGLAAQSRSARPDPTAPRVTRIKAEQLQRALYQQLDLTYADFFVDAKEFGIPMAQSNSDDTYPFQPADAYLAPRTAEPRDRFSGLGGGSVVNQQRPDFTTSPTFVLTLTQLSQRWCRMSYKKTGSLALFPSGTARATDEANVKATIRRWFLHFHGTQAKDADVDSLYTKVFVPLAAGSAEAGWVGLCSTYIRHPDWVFY